MATEDDRPEGQAELQAQVQALHLAPGDTLVLSVADYIAEETRSRLRGRLATAFPDHKALVLDGGTTLSTVSQQGGQLDRIEALLVHLVEALAEDDEDEPGMDLDGGPSGAAREQGAPL